MSNEVYLAHYGTKGMKWGRRRYQNKDGSLTRLGKMRYGIGGYADDIWQNKKTPIGKLVDLHTGENIVRGTMRYARAGKEGRQQKAESHLKKVEALRGYAQDEYNKNTSVVGKVIDSATGYNKLRASQRYKYSSDADRAERAKQFADDRKAMYEKKSNKKKKKKDKKQRRAKRTADHINKHSSKTLKELND